MAKHQLKPFTIYCGDNLKMLQEIPDETIDLIYIDPPFNSNRNYEVFWGDVSHLAGVSPSSPIAHRTVAGFFHQQLLPVAEYLLSGPWIRD